MTLKERMFYLIEKEGMNPNQFYRKSGLGNGYLDKVGDTFRRPTIAKLEKTFPHWNLDWILYEKGEPYQEVPEQKPAKIFEVSPVDDSVVYVPLVNQYAYGGYLYGYNDATYMNQLPKIPFIVDYEGRGNYLAFEVKGDSMDDASDESYKEGDRLLCREIGQHLWAQSPLHHKKWDFVIVHEDGILLKRIVAHDVENHTITIHSLNDFYPDRVIDLAEVRQIFNVIESIRPRRR